MICVCVCAAPRAYYSLSNCPPVLLSPFLSSQFRGSAEGMYEKQKFSSLLSGETGNSQPFITAGDLPAQTCAEDPQIPPAPPGTTSDTAFTIPNVLCNYILQTVYSAQLVSQIGPSVKQRSCNSNISFSKVFLLGIFS